MAVLGLFISHFSVKKPVSCDGCSSASSSTLWDGVSAVVAVPGLRSHPVWNCLSPVVTILDLCFFHSVKLRISSDGCAWASFPPSIK